MENSQGKQFISFKLHSVLHRVMKSHTILLHPTWDRNHPFVQCFPPVSHSVAVWVTDRLLWFLSACAQVTLLLSNNGPKAQE